ncbi:hypothetical protein DNJ95_05200 [Stutzerimonas kirkiae]|uniref:Glyoxalase-like domain-containing protein n=1 Tax=Stutzerimonas kirkiae TaxID=2211392 RepID=A0A4Q9RC62_9GAMM|nr:VOC family protein [Stutzerimonas kirkiae]TBU97877.1 hypothetical protein DNJ96_07070 [Stutzerimonas kirkiae]TBV04607.1 hypothetical protein DNJ95_05200 [Stutzerimonas kirkiae]TBV16055.1 hypothetical protein DNK01_03545 [Stutzerimonas kirkiae]
MNDGILDIDHVTCVVADPDAAGRQLQALGFSVAPLSVMATAGVANRLVLFEPATVGVANFIELMGIVDRERLPATLLPHLEGERGHRWLVLSGPDAAASVAALRQRGYGLGEPLPIRRELRLESGEVLRIAFDVAMPIEAPLPFNFCQYRTLEHYLHPSLLRHANGARSLTGLLCRSQQPEALLGYFETLFGRPRREHGDGLASVSPAALELLVATDAAWHDWLATALPAQRLHPHQVFGCRIRVDDLAATAAWFAAHGVAGHACRLGLAVAAPVAELGLLVFHQ